MTQFYIGQQVVCVDAHYTPAQRVSIPCELEEGRIYTIRWIGEFDNYVDGPFIGVRLAEIHRGTDPTYGYEDPPFAARRFRPLVKDPLAWARRLAADPNAPIVGEEEPLRAPPDDGGAVKERELEEAQ